MGLFFLRFGWRVGAGGGAGGGGFWWGGGGVGGWVYRRNALLAISEFLKTLVPVRY